MSIPGSASSLFFQTAAGAGAAAGPIKSVRFNRSDSARLYRTFAAGNRKTFTLSWWMKHCSYTNNARIFAKGLSADQFSIMHSGTSDDRRRFYCYFNLESPTDTSSLIFAGEHRDFSSWAHYVVAFDTTQATDSDRIKFYYNGVQQTDFIGTPNWPTQNASFKWNNSGDTYYIGGISSYHIDAYLADMYHVDGQQLDCTSFGEFDDNGVWQAAEYSGTFGTNGFHLFDFANESGIGNDSSGNDNDFTVNNLENKSSNNTDGIDNVVNITQVQNNGTNVDVNLANLQTMMNTSTFQDADTDQSDYGVRVSGTSKKFAVKWSGLTGLTGVSVRWQRAATYDADVRTSGTGISTSTVTVTSSRSQETFATTSTSGSILFEDVTSGDTNGFFIRAIEFKGYGSVTYPTNVENFSFPGSGQDVLFDVPTNGDSSDDTGAGGEVSGNYATLNPLSTAFGGAQLINGNLEWDYVSSGNYNNILATMDVSNGKYYWEWTYETGKTGGIAGITSAPAAANQRLGREVDFGLQSSTVRENGTSYGNFTGGGLAQQKTFAFAYDGPNRRVRFFIDGVEQTINSNSYYDLTSISASDKAFPAFNTNNNDVHFKVNFGARSFAYSAPSGYSPLCTTLLPTPTIADGSDYFDVSLWNGNSGTTTISGLEFSPDWVWLKSRSTVIYHTLQDTVRGYDKALYLGGNPGTAAEATITDAITSFNSDGYTLGSRSTVNFTGRTYVGWAWDAGSSTVSNTDGTITSQVRANQTAGFSIVSYTGTGSAGTIGHGLNAQPHMVIVKNRSTSGYNWKVLHKNLTGFGTYMLSLDTNEAETAASASWFNSTAPTSSVISLGSLLAVNGSNEEYICYAFAPVAGYSAFGSYTGNGSSDGPFVYTGFRARWILVKAISSVTYGNWIIHDTARSTYNVSNKNLYANLSNQEDTSYSFDILSNGFKIRNTAFDGHNGSGKSYLYAAFAENPLHGNGGLAR